MRNVVFNKAKRLKRLAKYLPIVLANRTNGVDVICSSRLYRGETGMFEQRRRRRRRRRQRDSRTDDVFFVKNILCAVRGVNGFTGIYPLNFSLAQSANFVRYFQNNLYKHDDVYDVYDTYGKRFCNAVARRSGSVEN